MDFPLDRPGTRHAQTRLAFLERILDWREGRAGDVVCAGGIGRAGELMELVGALGIVCAIYCNAGEATLTLVGEVFSPGRGAARQTILLTVDLGRELPIKEMTAEMEKALSGLFQLAGGSATLHTTIYGRCGDDFQPSIVAAVNLCRAGCRYRSPQVSAGKAFRFLAHVENVLRQVRGQNTVRITDIRIVTPDEERDALKDFNQGISNPGVDVSFWMRFQAASEGCPDKTAILYAGGAITYRVLHLSAVNLSRALCKEGVRPGDAVVLILEKKHQQVMAILSVLALGAAFIPVAADASADHIRSILSSSGPSLILTEAGLWGGEPGGAASVPVAVPIPVMCIPDVLSAEQGYDCGSLPGYDYRPDDPAYVLFTSGTTGPPRGIKVTQRSLSNYVAVFAKAIALQNTDVVLQQYPYIFDGFLEEVLPALSVGAAIAIPGRACVENVSDLAAFIGQQKVSVISCTPLLLGRLNGLGRHIRLLKGVRVFVSGGDTLKAEHCDHLSAFATVFNTYGPTQTTISATIYTCKKRERFLVPIGKALPSYGVIVLNDYGQLAPRGVYGEICIAGAGLAEGYLNDSALTREKFVSMELGGYKRIYKTGDIGRVLESGDLEFCGRMPCQRNLVGLQIFDGNPGMKILYMEHRLAKFKGIRGALGLPEGDGAVRMYYLADIPVDEDAMRAYLSLHLEIDMPLFFTRLDGFPSDRNGKLCRRSIQNGVLYR
jgi:amino acid adenylation domain-containing protein